MARVGAWAATLGLGLGALGLYARTAAPTITWRNGGADGAELAAVAWVGGVAHPPGYPVYVALLGAAEHVLPWGDAAHRGALLSVGLAAAAVAVAHRAALRLVGADRPGQVAAAVAAALVAVAPGLWSQATIVEVYAGSALIVATALWLVVAHARSPGPRSLVGLGAVAGAALAHHPTLLLAALGLVPLLLRRPRPPRRAWLAAAALALAVPTLAYTTLLLRAGAEPALSWGEPRTLERLWAHASAEVYRPYVLAGSPLDLIGRVPPAVRFLGWQYTWVGLALALLGGAAVWRADRALALGLAWWAAAAFAFTLAYYAADPENYLLPAVLVLGVLVAAGARGLLGSARWSVAVAAGVALLVPLQVLANAAQLDLSRDREARTWGEELLGSAPADGLVLTGEDRHTFSLWYLQLVDGLRPDVVVADRRLLAQPWYRAQLERRRPGVVAQAEQISGP